MNPSISRYWSRQRELAIGAKQKEIASKPVLFFNFSILREWSFRLENYSRAIPNILFIGKQMPLQILLSSFKLCTLYHLKYANYMSVISIKRSPHISQFIISPTARNMAPIISDHNVLESCHFKDHSKMIV